MAATRPTVHGLHHVTSIAAAPQENLDFYVGVMGLRLVKRSVNQDAPGTYHLFYADEAGTPGTDLTFFPWPDMAPVREGSGQAREVQFGVAPGSAEWWRERLESRGFEADTPAPRFGESTLPLRDPHGHRIALVETEDERPWVPWEGATVPAERQLRGMHAVRMVVRELAPTRRVLEEVLGFEEVGEEDGWRRFGVEGGGSGRWLEIREEPDARLGPLGNGGRPPRGLAGRGRPGTGGAAGAAGGRRSAGDASHRPLLVPVRVLQGAGRGAVRAGHDGAGLRARRDP